MSSPQNTSNHLEALKLVKDWSSGLVVIQSAAIGVIGSLLKQPPSGLYFVITFALLSSLIFSIWVGAVWVNGTVPYITQKLPSLIAKNPDLDIYDQMGGIKGNPSLGKQCELQRRSFIISLVLFALFIILLPPQLNSN